MSFLAPYADLMLLVMSIIFTSSLFPTLWHQHQTRSSTITLGTVGMSGVALTLGFLAYSSLGLWFTTGMVVVNAAVWAMVGLQRVRYGGGN